MLNPKVIICKNYSQIEKVKKKNSKRKRRRRDVWMFGDAESIFTLFLCFVYLLDFKYLPDSLRLEGHNCTQYIPFWNILACEHCV